MQSDKYSKAAEKLRDGGLVHAADLLDEAASVIAALFEQCERYKKAAELDGRAFEALAKKA